MDATLMAKDARLTAEAGGRGLRSAWGAASAPSGTARSPPEAPPNPGARGPWLARQAL